MQNAAPEHQIERRFLKISMVDVFLLEDDVRIPLPGSRKQNLGDVDTGQIVEHPSDRVGEGSGSTADLEDPGLVGVRGAAVCEELYPSLLSDFACWSVPPPIGFVSGKNHRPVAVF